MLTYFLPKCRRREGDELIEYGIRILVDMEMKRVLIQYNARKLPSDTITEHTFEGVLQIISTIEEKFTDEDRRIVFAHFMNRLLDCMWAQAKVASY